MRTWEGALACDACPGQLEVDVDGPLYSGAGSEKVVSGVQCLCGKDFCGSCAPKLTRDRLCIDCLAAPRIDAQHARALARSILALEEERGLIIPQIARTAWDALRRVCPCPEGDRAVYFGSRVECSLCGGSVQSLSGAA